MKNQISRESLSSLCQYDESDVLPSEPTTFVTFIVGTAPNTKEFMVHKEVACFQSPIFDHAFNDDVGSTEFESQTFCLENVTPRTFQMLVQWMYSNTIRLRQLRGEAPFFSGFEVTDDVKREEDMTMACLWVLAEKLKMPKLQNTLIERIDRITNLCQQIPCATYHYIYRSTKEDSPLRKYTIESATKYIDVKTLRDKEAELPRSLLVVLAVGMLEHEYQREQATIPPWARDINGGMKRFADTVRTKDYFVDVE